MTTQFITLRPLVEPLLCLGATVQGLRVINFVDTWVLKFNLYIDSGILLPKLRLGNIISLGVCGSGATGAGGSSPVGIDSKSK